MRGSSLGTGASSAGRLEAFTAGLPALSTPQAQNSPGAGQALLSHSLAGAQALQLPRARPPRPNLQPPHAAPAPAGHHRRGRRPRTSGGLARRAVPTRIPVWCRPVSLQLRSTAMLLPACQLNATFTHVFVVTNRLPGSGARPRRTQNANNALSRVASAAAMLSHAFGPAKADLTLI